MFNILPKPKKIQTDIIIRGLDYSRTRKQVKTANYEGKHSFSHIYA
jgi:hypothetical protein